VPLTFPSHAAAVLPLKLWRPRRFDGIALVIGSAAPDLAYPFAAIVAHPTVHSVPGLFWWCLPVTVLLTWVVRRASPRVAAHLPAGGLALRDYGALGGVRHRWWITLWSALVGSATHLLWDGVTHSPQTNGFGATLLPWLAAEPLPGLPWYRALQHASSVLGAIAAVALAVYIGRRSLIRRWHGPPPDLRRRPVLFWTVAGVVLAGYPATWPVLTHLYQTHVQGTRLLSFASFGLLAGAAATALADRLGRKGSRPPAGGVRSAEVATWSEPATTEQTYGAPSNGTRANGTPVDGTPVIRPPSRSADGGDGGPGPT
jgi:hypothetical protein